MNGLVPHRTRVLVVDDDTAIRQMLTSYLSGQDMAVTAVNDGPELGRHLAGDQPDLVLLDLRLEREDGLDLLRAIRASSDVPVIIMTGHRRDEIDRVVGLELGADDYVTKPFGLRELLARVRAVLRRSQTVRNAPEEAEPVGYCFDGWQLEVRQRRLINPVGELVPLTKSEFGLLLAFVQSPGRPLSREHLLQSTRVHEDIFDRSIDVQVLRLRRKLEVDARVPRAIQTERGVGYTFGLEVARL